MCSTTLAGACLAWMPLPKKTTRTSTCNQITLKVEVTMMETNLTTKSRLEDESAKSTHLIDFRGKATRLICTMRNRYLIISGAGLLATFRRTWLFTVGCTSCWAISNNSRHSLVIVENLTCYAKFLRYLRKTNTLLSSV